MATIWKFPIPIQDEFTIAMPKGAELLHVEVQHGQPCVWARVDPDLGHEDRALKLRGTGHPVDPECRHVGSFLLHEGALVFHLFDAATRQ